MQRTARHARHAWGLGSIAMDFFSGALSKLEDAVLGEEEDDVAGGSGGEEGAEEEDLTAAAVAEEAAAMGKEAAEAAATAAKAASSAALRLFGEMRASGAPLGAAAGRLNTLSLRDGVKNALGGALGSAESALPAEERPKEEQEEREGASGAPRGDEAALEVERLRSEAGAADERAANAERRATEAGSVPVRRMEGKARSVASSNAPNWCGMVPLIGV